MNSDNGKTLLPRPYQSRHINDILSPTPNDHHTPGALTKFNAPEEPSTARNARKLLRVWIRSPWDHYGHIAYLHPSQRVTLVYQRKTYFDLAVMREQPPGFDDVVSFRTLSGIHHPNIAKTYDIYFYDEKTFVVTEHLDLSLAQVDLQTYQLEEWEIATIIAQVLKGVNHLLSMGLSCRRLSINDVYISIRGDIKIVLDPQHLKKRQGDFSQLLLEVPVLAQIIEEMMLPQYHVSFNSEGWSDEALDFLSCSLLGSIQGIMNHKFLKNAKSTRRLIPRIRFALECLKNTHDFQDSGSQDGGLCKITP